MTIAISINVNDGIVLASDSASSLVVSNDQGNTSVQNIYNNADKIYNLYKGLPIGAMTWGSGSVGTASIATLAKDFRRVLMQDAGFDKEGYTIEDVAQRFKQFIYDERYVPEYQAWTSKPSTGFLVAGYSAGSQLAETWKIVIDENAELYNPILGDINDSVSSEHDEEFYVKIEKNTKRSSYPILLTWTNSRPSVHWSHQIKQAR